MANNNALPVKIGLLYDFPQMGTLLKDTLQLGIDEVAATGRLDRDIEFVERASRGLPSGTEAEVTRAFADLVDQDVVAIVGPSISDNGLIVAPLCDAARVPAINYTGGERTRSANGCSTTRSVRSKKSRRCSRRGWSRADSGGPR